MKKEELLEKVQSKKVYVGEMEKQKINKSNWMANIVTVAAAIVLIIVLGVFKNFEGLYAIAALCYLWAAAFYICQYFVAKRPWPVLIGGVLHGLAFIAMLVLFILKCCGVL